VILASACGSAEPAARSARYGISMDVPDGVSAQLTRGTIRIATSDLSVVLYEYEPAAGDTAELGFFKDAWPVRLDAADFGRPLGPGTSAENTRAVAVAGRYFSVFAEGPAEAPRRQIDGLNEALAGIDVKEGDFYRGSVKAVGLPGRAGWHAVSSGRGARYPHGEYVQAAAATIPYRNDPNDLPPNRTLEELPRDGILVWISLGRDARLPRIALERSDSYERTHPPPYRLSELHRVDGWEGQVRDIPDYRLWGVVGDRYIVDLRVYFGQEHPTQAMLAEADAVVRALRFPDWGPWELEDVGG
jgi:hypothetical protein